MKEDRILKPLLACIMTVETSEEERGGGVRGLNKVYGERLPRKLDPLFLHISTFTEKIPLLHT